MNKSPSIRDVSPAGAAVADQNLLIDREAYQRLVSRRDAVQDRLRFGIITLNAGSLLALLSCLGGNGQAAKWLGFDAYTASISTAAFVAGLILASIAVIVDLNKTQVEAGKAFARAGAAGRVVALNEAPFTQQNLDTSCAEFERYAALPLVGFQYSKTTIALQSFAQGSWLVGILVPLSRAGGWS